MAQLINITSEALQATIRRLLPSQQGFGEDLQASNVITPIIDLTPSAEGSELPRDLAIALAHGSQTVFDVKNATSPVVSTTGFYRITAVSSVNGTGSATNNNRISLYDGSTFKIVWKHAIEDSGSFGSQGINVDLTVFIGAGESLVIASTSTDSNIAGSVRQVADINGNLVNPSGYTSE